MQHILERTAIVAVGLMLAAGAGLAQSDRFEKTLPFKVGQSHNVGAKLGPVEISTLKITNLGRGYGRGRFALPNAPSETETTLRFAFDAKNPSVEWEITYTIELLDKAGKLIDRYQKKESYEEEAKISNLDLAILEYVVPMISEVKLTLYGRLD